MKKKPSYLETLSSLFPLSSEPLASSAPASQDGFIQEALANIATAPAQPSPAPVQPDAPAPEIETPVSKMLADLSNLTTPTPPDATEDTAAKPANKAPAEPKAPALPSSSDSSLMEEELSAKSKRDARASELNRLYPVEQPDNSMALLTMLRGAAQMGGGLASRVQGVDVKPDVSGIDAAQKDITTMQKMLQDATKMKMDRDKYGMDMRLEAEKDDPNSQISQTYRTVAEKAGLKLKGNETARALEGVLGKGVLGGGDGKFVYMGAVEGGHPAWYNTQTRQLSIEPNVKMAEKGQLMKDLDTGENKIFLPRSKTTIPLGQKAALDLPTDRPLTYNEQIRKDYYDLNRAQKDKVMDFRDQVTKDKLVAEARDSLMSVDMALSLIDANIPGSGGAIKRGLLKMFESGGRFTNEDVQQFGGEQSALARLTRMAILETQGKDLSPDDQKYAKQLALVIQRKTQDKLKEATNRYTEDLVRIGVPEQTAGRAILGGLIDTPTLWIDPKTKRKVAVSNAQSAAALSKGLLPPWHAEEANLQTELTKYEEAAAKAAKGK